MKVAMLLSAAVTTFAFIGCAQAALIPESTADIQRCHAWAETHNGTPNYEHAIVRCEALNNCMVYHSDNNEELRECTFAAESGFLRATSGHQAQGPYGVDQAQVYQAPSGVVTPAVTNVADSHYETIPGNKGWKNSTQE